MLPALLEPVGGRELGQVAVLRADVEEQVADTADDEVRHPYREEGGEMAAFAQADEEVIQEQEAEEDEYGACDAAQGTTTGEGDAERGSHEHEHE